MRYLVVGLGVSGEAVARALAGRGERVTVVEDRPGVASRGRAERLTGVDVREAPSPEELSALVRETDVVVPSPGVPAHHPVYALAARSGVPVRGEVELASTWTDCRLVAVTGTNGKTTVTSLITDMLRASDISAVAAGNIGLPLVDAIGLDAQVFVVEVSSFQLSLTDRFRPDVAVWLNFAEDHLDWHPTVEDYLAAKARIWTNQRPDDVAVVNSDDSSVMAAAGEAPGRVVTFGLGGGADWTVKEGALCGPRGETVARVDELTRTLPHDLSNALAASAAALAGGATVAGVHEALVAFRGLPHRMTPVGDAGGVRWFDDSKATNPHAALAAVRSFDSVVLIAGGLNKGLDLGVLAAEADRIRAVVAIGDAADEVERAFVERVEVISADSMDTAVSIAARVARSGDAVLLSPACASFDRYQDYKARGDDFARAVHDHLEAHSP